MDPTDLAYAAGAIDADGCISIKRTTQRMRLTRDCRNPVYSPRISLGQVTPQVPAFLRSMFGGLVYTTRPGTKNSRPLFKWQVSDRSAAGAAEWLMPFLKIKGRQAAALIELRDFKADPANRKLAAWYAREHPDWASEELVTASQCASIMGYKSTELVSQAIAQGTLLCANPGRHGRCEVPKIPKALVLALAELKGRGTKFISCPQMIQGQHAIWEKVARLNKIGVNGTCVNHRTGYYAPAQ